MSGYETLGTDAARTPLGATVRVLGRAGLRYETPEGGIEISSELLATPMAIAVYPSSIVSPFRPAEQVLTDLVGALDHLGFSVRLIGQGGLAAQ